MEIADFLFRARDIYNYYIKTSAVAMELDTLSTDVWRNRMDDCREEGYEMFVAVQKKAIRDGPQRINADEPVYGFTYAEDSYGKRSSGRFTGTCFLTPNSTLTRGRNH